VAKVGDVIWELLRSLGRGIMLGAACGATYGCLHMVIRGVSQNDFSYAFVGAAFGAGLGAVGGSVTGLAAGLVSLLFGRRLLALAWWLGGAAGGYLAARIMSIGWDNDLWWLGLPTLIGAAVGAGFGWWEQ
jgi:hypothetical protein